MQGAEMIKGKDEEIKVRKRIRNEEGLKEDKNSENLLFTV
jgi:hypothetical protein